MDTSTPPAAPPNVDAFTAAMDALQARKGGNVTPRQMRSIEKSMGMSVFAIAQEYLGVKFTDAQAAKPEDSGQTPGQTPEQAAAAEQAARDDTIAHAMRQMSCEKACRLVAGVSGAVTVEEVEELRLDQVGELYRVAMDVFMDAFGAFNGQGAKGGKAKPADSTS